MRGWGGGGGRGRVWVGGRQFNEAAKKKSSQAKSGVEIESVKSGLLIQGESYLEKNGSPTDCMCV